MSRVWVFTILLLTYTIVLVVDPQQHLIATSVNGQYSLSVSTSAFSVGATLALSLFVVSYPQKPGKPLYKWNVRTIERFAAFQVDVFLVAFISMHIISVQLLIGEATETGVFSWSFSRENNRHTDALSTLALFPILFIYLYAHPINGRQTVGQYLVGFKVESLPGADRKPAYGLNILYSLIGICIWPVSLYLAAGRHDKSYWWNLKTGTRLVRLE